MTGRLILASASPRRLEILSQGGIVPDKVVPAAINEACCKGESLSKLAIRLARQKAIKIGNSHHGDYILGADTIVACGRRELGKTENELEAKENLGLLSGKRHKVFGGIGLVLPNGRVVSRLVTTVVQFKRLSQNEIFNYIRSGEWRGRAGAYSIQGRAQVFIKRINGSFSNVVGLDLYETVSLLDGNGYGKGKLLNGNG